MTKNIFLKLIIAILMTLIAMNVILASNLVGNSINTGQEYITDESGNVYIHVNILGHVKKPGTYLIYEGADILTILAQAGGPLPGAKLKSTVIYHGESDMVVLDLENYLETGNVDIELKPNDTIYIKQTVGSYLFSNSNLINSMLQVLNIYLTISTISK